MALWRLIIIAGLLLFAAGYVHVYGAQEDVLDYQEPLTQFYQFVHDVDLEVEEWHIRVRDQRLLPFTSEDDFMHDLEQLFQSNKNWVRQDLDMTGTDWSALYTYEDDKRPVKEAIRINMHPISPESNERNRIISYQIQANDLITEYDLNEIVEQRITELGLDEGEAYVQLRAIKEKERTNTTNIQTQAYEWLEHLDAQAVEELVEEQFISLSAYQPEWGSGLMTGNEHMNVQIALRDVEGMGARTRVTIGTPIITTEY
ncbi:YwmB family TATA-box binding protein [Halalkalibacter sp. AB-rgal2]|uniref:YwmB family TATA-box binding protein n=1 Tax=Halalkalibacter sp. AB-rgal2 TaxID=3242695 RepID=UPI00359E54D7